MSVPVPPSQMLGCIDPITKEKVVRSLYWTQRCARLDVLGVCEAAIDLQFVGGVVGEYRTPTPYLCLLYRLLELGPTTETIEAMWKQEVHKYLRVMALHYARLVASKKPHGAAEAKTMLAEVMEADYRKIKSRQLDGKFVLVHVDEVCELLLNERDWFGINIPAMR